MRSTLAKILCLIAAFSLLEGQTVVYQTYAWATMISDRAPERGITEALDSTFSGEEPCPHCRKIAETQSKKKREQAPIPELTPIAKAVSSRWAPITLSPPSPQRTTFTPWNSTAIHQFRPSLPVPPPDSHLI